MALNQEDKADVKGAMGKALANKVSKVTRDGVDKNKRWGNSGIKGVGANSPAMMEARKGFAKSKALQGKSGGKYYEKKIASGVNVIRNGKVDSKMSRLFGLDK